MNTSIKYTLLLVAAICLQQTSGSPILPQQISGNSIAQQIAQELQQAANNAKIGLENAEHSIVLTSGPSVTAGAADTPKVVESISSIEQQIANSVSGQQIAGELQQAANNAKIGLENAEHSIVLAADTSATADATNSVSSIEQQIIDSPSGQQIAGELQQAANNAQIGLANAEHSIVLATDTGATAGASQSASSIEQQIISSPFGQQIAGELQQAANNAKIGLTNAEHSIVLTGTPNLVPSTVNLVPHVIVGGINVASAAAGDAAGVVQSAISAEDHAAAAGAKVAVIGVQTATNVVPAVIQSATNIVPDVIQSVPDVIQSGIKIATTGADGLGGIMQTGANGLGGILQTGANGMAHILSGIFCKPIIL